MDMITKLTASLLFAHEFKLVDKEGNEEEWKNIKDFEGYYQVSNLGRILNVKKLLKIKAGNDISKCFLKLHSNPRQYQKVTLCKPDFKKAITVHRIVCATFHENPENKPCVNHINGIKTDNRAVNLEWCTHKENNNHAWETGLVDISGENSPMGVLKKENVYKIYSLRKQGLLHAEIALIIGVERATVGEILRGDTWKCVYNELNYKEPTITSWVVYKKNFKSDEPKTEVVKIKPALTNLGFKEKVLYDIPKNEYSKNIVKKNVTENMGQEIIYYDWQRGGVRNISIYYKPVASTSN